MTFYEPRTKNFGLVERDPFKALVTPRPIGWIATISGDGVANLAPYSFFNAVSDDPPFVAFASQGRKDTLANIENNGEFSCNLVGHDLKDAMNESSASVAPDVDEFELAKLTPAQCRLIKPPRVAESRVALECKALKIIPLAELDDDPYESVYIMVVGRVVGVHYDDDIVTDGRIRSVAAKPVARLGYSEYAVVNDTFRMTRPE